jgi:CheY-like chemotaxis protein
MSIATTDQSPEPVPGSSERTLVGTTVLVVDDDLRNTYAMKALLEACRARVVIASSGPAGIVMLVNTAGIDIVLMDIMMPVMDGYETIRTVRTIGRFRDLPIIAVTGKVVTGERERCLEAGATDYIPKPVHSLELLKAIRPWVPFIKGDGTTPGYPPAL